MSLQSSVCQSCSDVPAGDAAPEPVRATCSSTLLKMQLSFHYFPHTNLSPNHPLLILKSIDSFMKLFHCLFCSENKTTVEQEQKSERSPSTLPLFLTLFLSAGRCVWRWCSAAKARGICGWDWLCLCSALWPASGGWLLRRGNSPWTR